MATIPTYRDLEDRIEVLEGKLKYWSGLSSFEPEFDKVHWVTNDDGTECQVQHIMKTEEWDDERMDIIGQNGNDGLHYNEDKEGM